LFCLDKYKVFSALPDMYKEIHPWMYMLSV
jgi:hypothetical protein